MRQPTSPAAAPGDPWTPTSELAPYRVLARERRTPTIVELLLAPLAEPLAYLPGQYVLLEDRDGEVPPRSYSIANAPRDDGRIALLVTRVADGPTSGWVHERLAVGDEVRVSGPYGAFVSAAAATRPALYLAAGSGLAPIRALIEAELERPRRPALTLLFSARTEADVIDGERFAAWQRDEPRFRFLRTLTRGAGPPPRGRLPGLLAELAGRLDGAEVFIAGAPGFVAACADAAERLGAPRALVHTEVFYAEPQPWSGAAPQASEPRR